MKYKQQIPNACTLMNMSMGILAIIYTFSGSFNKAALFIIVAAMLDRMDGKLARKLDVVSDFGKELDSLCDAISFGLAPALLIWNLSLVKMGNIGLIVTLIFALCGTVRLARYNIMEFDGVYMGIPITACGGLVALIALYSTKYNTNLTAVLFMMLFLSYAMVSKKIKLKKR